MTRSPESTLERIARRVPVPEPAYERLLRRRDRMHRNQRIIAGSVGFAVFVAGVLAVTSIGSIDGTRTPSAPGESGPTETGTPSEIHDVEDPFGLPPQGVLPSTPEEGEVVARFEKKDVGFVYVYADGRVIYSGDAIGPQPTGTIVERRLTPQGLDLVSSGLLDPRNLLERPERPLGGTGVGSTVVWADQMNPYVPPRYAVCYADEETDIVDPSSVVGLLPERAEALLRGKERTYHHTAGLGGYIPSATCFELTIDEARMLDDTLRRADFERGTWRGGTFSWSQPDLAGKRIWIVFAPLLPQGEWVEW